MLATGRYLYPLCRRNARTSTRVDLAVTRGVQAPKMAPSITIFRPSNPQQASRRSILTGSPPGHNRHRTRCTDGAQLPATSCLGASRTPAIVRVARSVKPVSEKPAQEETSRDIARPLPARGQVVYVYLRAVSGTCQSPVTSTAAPMSSAGEHSGISKSDSLVSSARAVWAFVRGWAVWPGSPSGGCHAISSPSVPATRRGRCRRSCSAAIRLRARLPVATGAYRQRLCCWRWRLHYRARHSYQEGVEHEHD